MTRTSLFVIVALILTMVVPAIAVPTATSSVAITHVAFQPVQNTQVALVDDCSCFRDVNGHIQCSCGGGARPPGGGQAIAGTLVFDKLSSGLPPPFPTGCTWFKPNCPLPPM